MSIGTAFASDLIGLIFNGIDIAGIADNAAVSPATDFYVSLHYADPSAGNQTTNETTYPNYARVQVARDGTGWVITGINASPAANIEFAISGFAASQLTHVAVGLDYTGPGKILAVGELTPPIPIEAGVKPIITTSTIIRFI